MFYISIYFLLHLLMSSNSAASSSLSTVIWNTEEINGLVSTIRESIDGTAFADADWSTFSFQDQTGKEAVEKFLLAGEQVENWRAMPAQRGETNIFSLLGRAYVEGFPNVDYDKAAKYFIYGALLEVVFNAGTGTAIAFSYISGYGVLTGLNLDSTQAPIDVAIETLKSRLAADSDLGSA
jgi:hypothetical protein